MFGDYGSSDSAEQGATEANPLIKSEADIEKLEKFQTMRTRRASVTIPNQGSKPMNKEQ